MHGGDEAVWDEWLSLYLDHCRHELTRHQLAELATALQHGVSSTAMLPMMVSEGTASKARWLVDFLVSPEAPELRAVLQREAIKRLRRAARSR
jgi:hypothetical protein